VFYYVGAGTPRRTQPISVRTLAVQEYCRADFNAAKAVRRLKRRLDTATFHSIKAPCKFVKNQHTKFMDTGSVHDRYGRKRKFSDPETQDVVALRAAKILKFGFKSFQEIPASDQNKKPMVVPVHSHYGTLKEALDRSVGLKELMLEAKIKPKQLLKRMEAADPDLVQRTIYYKVHHSGIAIAQRMRVTAENMDRAAADPDFLRGVVWIDEATMWLVNDKHYKRKVWCSAKDWEHHLVVRCPMMAKKKPVKVHVLCAVNYELGPFFIEFTTGTTGIKRLHIEDKVYRVSGSRQV
jgi:hypothetical protein